MIATIVYSNTAHEDQPRCIQSPYPNVCEFNNVKNLRYKIIDLQYFYIDLIIFLLNFVEKFMMQQILIQKIQKNY